MTVPKFGKVLYELVKILDQNQIEYLLSGSLAGKFYGLKREPHDIDIYVFSRDVEHLEKIFADKITKALYRCKDDFYGEDILEILFDGVVVEFCVVDTGFMHSLVTGETMPTLRFYKPVDVPLNDIFVKIQSLDALIGYKSHNTNTEFAGNQIEDVLELRKRRLNVA